MSSVSHSETDSYLLCRRKHYYGYTKSLKRIGESDSLTRGTAGHAVLEAFYSKIRELAGDNQEKQYAAFKEALEAADQKLTELEAEGVGNSDRSMPLRAMLFDYYFPNEPYVLNKWTILAVEKEFSLEYDEEGSTYPFVVDMIAIDPQHRTVVVDHKFVYDFYTSDASDLQPQIPKYIGALRALGFKIDYGQYNMVRYRKIKEPRAEQITTQLDVTPNGVRVQTTFIEQIGVATELKERKKLPVEVQAATAYRTANKMVCQSCSFADLCKAELQGQDAALVERNYYEIRERRVIEVTKEINNG
jgi:RecB family exonuclease